MWSCNGRALKLWTILDEYSRECLVIDVSRHLTSEDVLERLGRLGVGTLYVKPGSPWENGHLESFSGKLRDKLLAREVRVTLLEAKVLVARWRRHHNAVRPHSALGYRPPAPEDFARAAAATAVAALSNQ